MKSLKRSGLVELATDTLAEQLAAGTWPVGSALPGELKLAEQLGVGRSTVREATRSLVQAGLLESRQGSGTFVLATTSPQAGWNAALHAAQVIEVYEVREALEVQAAALAARRRSDRDLVRIRSAFEAREALVAHQHEQPEAFVAADLDFHRAVVEAAHNPLLLSVFDSVLPKLTDTLVALVHERSLDGHDLDGSHADLLAAIDASDPARAIASVTANVHDTIEIMRD
ncbi:FCD domain-containing protein [Herbiconiux sp.]|uniref:FadR/GntR family transcriptional regulator n=1 Tax=Herbiconiux sp. TaxID=1871186 RepID=UPI0025C60746|nr:FCD domain-containing protein [Herbiconiux sp.]